MQLIAHATMFEFAAGIVVFLAGMCVGPLLAYVISNRKNKDIRDRFQNEASAADIGVRFDQRTFCRWGENLRKSHYDEDKAPRR
jgi:hypothetical protein